MFLPCYHDLLANCCEMLRTFSTTLRSSGKENCLRHAEVTDLVLQTHQASQDADDEYYRKMDAHLGAVIVVLAFKMCAKTNKLGDCHWVVLGLGTLIRIL